MKKREKGISKQDNEISNRSEAKTQDNQLKVYSTLSRKKEVFKTLEDGKVKMYACGITASSDAHVGHALQAVVFDMIRKYLEFKGYRVTYVRNYTDIDDKIIISAKKQNIEPMQYARQVMLKTDAELDLLGVERPTIESRVTECMSDIIAFIEKLISKGHAYATDTGDVYFEVASFANYGNFSNRILEEDIHNVRIQNEANKKNEKDFALWKSAKAGEISWNSPWGPGRPGWHIECSVMSIKYLGETLDIHGGGRDLIFPHHENEIAQSEAVTGKQFSKYWVHNGLIKVNGQKMSKSLGNSVILQNILEKYNRDVIRLALLQNHYRSDVNITDCLFEKFEIIIYSMYKTFYAIETGSSGLVPQQDSPCFKQVSDSFTEAMDNDFNTPTVIANLLGYLTELNKLVSENKFQEALNLMTAIKQLYGIIGICQMKAGEVISEIRQKHLQNNKITEEEILEFISKRAKYKAEKNYAEADKIRDKLRTFSINIMDGREGSGWDLII